MIILCYHESTGLSGHSYREYGPTPAQCALDHGYSKPEVSFGTVAIGARSVATASLFSADAALGDDIGDGGAIYDPGGLALPVPVALRINPTLDARNIVLLRFVLTIIAFTALRRTSSGQKSDQQTGRAKLCIGGSSQ